MSEITIDPSSQQATVIGTAKINGSLRARPSKSYMQRAVALAVLANGNSVIVNPASDRDSQNALLIAHNFGLRINAMDGQLALSQSGEGIGNIIDCGESGLSLRMFSAIASLFNRSFIISGSGSLLKRPVLFDSSLSEHGVSIKTNNGMLPADIRGPITAGDFYVDGSISSQFITGLLMALPFLDGPSQIFVPDPVSKPYLQITLDMLQSAGITIHHNNMTKFHIPGMQTITNSLFAVENDWSSAAYHLVAAALSGNISMQGLNINSAQADKKILEALSESGAAVEIDKNGKVRLNKPEQMKAFEYDATDSPDLVPILAVMAANCQGRSIISGVDRLKYKESNRAVAIATELSKMGADIKLDNDKLFITGTGLIGAEVSSHNDHRISMALAIAAISAKGRTIINGINAIAKSYPEFFEDLSSIVNN